MKQFKITPLHIGVRYLCTLPQTPKLYLTFLECQIFHLCIIDIYARKEVIPTRESERIAGMSGFIRTGIKISRASVGYG